MLYFILMFYTEVKSNVFLTKQSAKTYLHMLILFSRLYLSVFQFPQAFGLQVGQ